LPIPQKYTIIVHTGGITINKERKKMNPNCNDALQQALADPTVFRINRLDAHSSHRYYQTGAEAKAQGNMNWRMCLNGTWNFIMPIM